MSYILLWNVFDGGAFMSVKEIEFFGVGSLASERNNQYEGLDITITEIAYDFELGLDGVIAYDTSDGKHWLSVANGAGCLESGASLINTKIFWNAGSGFSYAPLYWSEDDNMWVMDSKRPIPLK